MYTISSMSTETPTHIHKAFMTLVQLAGEIASIHQLVEAPSDEVSSLRGSQTVGQKLAELTNQLLDGRSVCINYVDGQKEKLQYFASAGFSPEQEKSFRRDIERSTLADYLDKADRIQLHHNKVVIHSFPQERFVRRSHYGARNILFAPMCHDGKLVGVFSVDRHRSYSQEEMDLIKAVAQLVLLVIERERLRQDYVLAHTHEMALQETNQRFTDFLAIASHELRTPLTCIKGHTQLALRRTRTLPADIADKVRESLFEAKGCADAQERIINDLLDTSRIQANEMKLHIQSCNLQNLISSSIETQNSVSPDHTIIVGMPEESINVMADPDRIQQVLNNFFTNAFKYSPATTPVHVDVEIEDDMARVSVTDGGPGLPPEEMERIWERFYRVEGIEPQNPGRSLGLGLYLSQIIIEAHKGSYGVISEPGQGSTFWFTLPRTTSEDES